MAQFVGFHRNQINSMHALPVGTRKPGNASARTGRGRVREVLYDPFANSDNQIRSKTDILTPLQTLMLGADPDLSSKGGGLLSDDYAQNYSEIAILLRTRRHDVARRFV